MSFIHKSSAKSELDLLHTPETQAMILNGKWVDYHPLHTIEGDVPIEFNVAGSEEEYIDLSETYLHLEVKIVDDKGADVQDTAKIAPANYFLHALFNQVEISLNNKLVTGSVTGYAYRSIIEALLNHGEDAKKTHLQSALFHKDTASKMDSITGDNAGFVKRKSYMKKTIEMYGRIHADIFFQNRYLLNNVNLQIKMVRNRSSFCLIGEGDFKINILQAILFVRKAKINPQVMLAHASILEKSSAKYPIRRVETKVLTITKDLSAYSLDNITTGPLPSRIVFGLVESDAYNGVIGKNPFNFQNFNLSRIAFSVDGEIIPYKPIECDYGSNKYVRAYHSLFTGVDKSVTTNGNFIERDEYPNGYCLYAFDLTPDLCNGEHFNLIKSGNLRINLDFKSALKTPVNGILYLEYQNIIEINKNRQILFDYTI